MNFEGESNIYLSTNKSLTFNERIFVDRLGPSQYTQPRPDLVQEVLSNLKYENMLSSDDDDVMYVVLVLECTNSLWKCFKSFFCPNVGCNLGSHLDVEPFAIVSVTLSQYFIVLF